MGNLAGSRRQPAPSAGLLRRGWPGNACRILDFRVEPARPPAGQYLRLHPATTRHVPPSCRRPRPGRRPDPEQHAMNAPLDAPPRPRGARPRALRLRGSRAWTSAPPRGGSYAAGPARRGRRRSAWWLRRQRPAWHGRAWPRGQRGRCRALRSPCVAPRGMSRLAAGLVIRLIRPIRWRPPAAVVRPAPVYPGYGLPPSAGAVAAGVAVGAVPGRPWSPPPAHWRRRDRRRWPSGAEYSTCPAASRSQGRTARSSAAAAPGCGPIWRAPTSSTWSFPAPEAP